MDLIVICSGVAVHRLVSYLPGDARLYRMMKASSVLKLFCDFREDASFEKGKQTR